MVTPTALARDLAYVRKGVERASEPVSNAPIYFLWAGIVSVGFALTDLAEPIAGNFWAVAGPVGGLISGVLGHRAARRAGHMARADGLRQAAHWGGMMACIFLSQLTMQAGAVTPQMAAALTILIVGLAYFYAGLYVQRILLWVAALQVVGFLTAVFRTDPPWTLIGASIAIGLIAVGVHDIRRTAVHHGPRLVTS